MRAGAGERLLVCCLPGFDLRGITAASCPHVAGLLDTCPWVALRTLPTVEHIPTMPEPGRISMACGGRA
jgi:hypothetical protein